MRKGIQTSSYTGFPTTIALSGWRATGRWRDHGLHAQTRFRLLVEPLSQQDGIQCTIVNHPVELQTGLETEGNENRDKEDNVRRISIDSGCEEESEVSDRSLRLNRQGVGFQAWQPGWSLPTALVQAVAMGLVTFPVYSLFSEALPSRVCVRTKIVLTGGSRVRIT